jgi:glycosyltransferase involved in cell wall biosynthesis
MSLAAIVPMKNEKGNVELMVNSAVKFKSLSEIIFIDGSSTDGTYEALLNCIKNENDTRIKVLKQTKPLGKFNAIKQCINQIKSENVLIWDGDNTIPENDIKNIVRLFFQLSKFEKVVVIANRINSAKEAKSFRFFNLIGNHAIAILMKPVLKDNIPDVLSGAKIFPKYILNEDNICLKLNSMDNFGDLTLLSNCNKFGIKIYSVECSYRTRFYGESKISRWNGGLNMFRVIFHIYLHRCNLIR